MSVVVALLFGTLYASGLPREFQFLALTQRLESYHRRTRPGLYVDLGDYTPVLDALTAAIPARTDNSLRQALTRRLEYGNEFALRRRLSDLLKSLVGSSDAVTTDPKAFVDAVVTERNYLTHYPPGVRADDARRLRLRGVPAARVPHATTPRRDRAHRGGGR